MRRVRARCIRSYLRSRRTSDLYQKSGSGADLHREITQSSQEDRRLALFVARFVDAHMNLLRGSFILPESRRYERIVTRVVLPWLFQGQLDDIASHRQPITVRWDRQSISYSANLANRSIWSYSERRWRTGRISLSGLNGDRWIDDPTTRKCYVQWIDSVNWTVAKLIGPLIRFTTLQDRRSAV